MFLLCALTAALALPPQAAWANIPEGTADGNNAIAIGEKSEAHGENSIAVGAKAEVGLDNTGGVAVAIGAGAQVTAYNSVAIGSGSIAGYACIVSVGDSESNLYRTITNVAQGTISDTSAEAITGEQVYNVIGDVIDAFLGKGVWGSKDGNYTFAGGSFSVDFSVGGQTYESVQDALNAVAAGVGTGVYNAVQYDSNAKEQITLAGGEGTVISNVADGENATDAVNKEQLDLVQGQLQGQINEHETTLNEHTVMIENHEGQFRTLQTILGGEIYDAPTFKSIKVGEITSDGVNIDMGGGTITGLADGNMSPGSTDAVTGN